MEPDRRSARPSPRRDLGAFAAGLLVPLLLLLTLPAAAAGQSGEESEDPLERAREAQRDFETYRMSRIPVERSRPSGICDEMIGRICIWYGGAAESDFPPEPPETERARKGLIGVLVEVDREVDDAWVTGQLVHYLVEQGDPRFAERLALECDIPEVWWCSMLLGYSRHVRGAFVEAEDAFRDGLAAMPADELRWWTTPRWILTEETAAEVGSLPDAERMAWWETFWRLSDPLYLVPGNDRLTDHLARLVEVRNKEDAGGPRRMEWGEDLAEALVRYGRTVGWSRTHSPGSAGSLTRDTRRTIGHHHPMSRGYLFPEDFLASPSEVPPESWITAPREARTWYAPPYAPDFRGLETQVGRFRRGDEMLVVGAYRPSRADPGAGGVRDPFDAPPEEVEAALFLVPLDGGAPERAASGEPEDVLTLRTRPGRWVGSLEVLEPGEARAWRARQGIRQEPLLPGLVGVSDILLLDEDAPRPESLEEAIPHVRPGIRVDVDEPFTIVWEVYGLQVSEPVRVSVGLTRGRPGFLGRVGEFLGVVGRERPLEITFTEEAPADQVQTVFRALEIELPELEPGEYTLHLRLDLAGREPVVTSRPIVVEE